MYSNDKKNGFSILDIIVKIIFAGLFIFILVWLFQKKVPNMKPFYSNVFRENIKYMQEAGESYFTDDKMPKEYGDTVKLTLSEMINKKLIIPFVDEDGNSCSETESYVSITKEIDDSYSLKTNLVCNKESDYTVKVLGCHTYCKDKDCSKTCSIEKITKYQYKKLVSGTSTKYSCPSGYKLSGKECTKSTTTTKDASLIIGTKSNTLTKDARLIVIGGSKVQLNTIVNSNKVYVDRVETTNKSYINRKETTEKVYVSKIEKNEKVYVDRIVKTIPGSTTTKTEEYACDKTEKQCTTTQVPYTYECNCTTHTVGFRDVISCSTCSGTTPKVECKDTKVKSTCTREVTVKGEDKTEYSCPSGTISEGSGSNLKCYKNSKTYSCPSGTKSEGSGSNLKCYTTKTTYSCPSGTISEGSGSNLKCYTTSKSYSCKKGSFAEGSGSNLKCYTINKTYSCPAETNAKEGSGSSLKCYKVTDGKTLYECTDKSYTLSGDTCYKVVTEQTQSYSCPSGFKLSGDLCKKTETSKIKATAKKSKYKYYTYKWSTATSLKGWTKTGKTKIENGKEICE